MPALRLPRISLRRVCSCAFLTAVLAGIVAIVYTILYIALPMRRAHYLELDYQRQLLSSNGVRPLVEHIPQLFYWTLPGSNFKTWDDLLGLNLDGTAADFVAGTDAWIYLAGTAQDSRQQPNSYEHKWKDHDCEDPAHICDMYLDAFERISRSWQEFGPCDRPRQGISRAILRWADCDVSPMLCSPTWGLAGVNLLVHMRVLPDCDYTMLPDGSCPVEWRWIALPIYQAPWTRQIRIPLDRGGSTVVPAFPSAEEQMLNIMAYEGAVEGVNYDNEETYPPGWNSMVTVTPQQNERPVADTGPPPFTFWGGFRSFVDNPWCVLEWPFESEIKCYIERYADVLLGWWDNATDIVQPRSCVGVTRETEEKCKERNFIWDYHKAHEAETAREKLLRQLDEAIRHFDEQNQDVSR